MIHYRDFSIKFGPLESDAYPISAEIGTETAEARFKPAFPLPELQRITSDLAAQAARKSIQRGSSSPVDPTEFGKQLFSRLFNGSVRDLYEKSRQELDLSQEGLRICFNLSSEDNTLAQLSQIPWEFICNQDHGAFVAMESGHSVVRYLKGPDVYVPHPFQSPLRVLVVLSNPIDSEPLLLTKEKEIVKKSWEECGGVQVDFVELATLQSIEEKLKSKQYHVLHFMGHGDFDEDGGGVLVLEHEDRTSHRVSGAVLGEIVHREPSMQLAFLNACETARAPTSPSALSGVADSMVVAGVPAVVAMQFPISDFSAIYLAKKFYEMLIDEYPVDASVAGARAAVAKFGRKNLEWATPALFMRVPDGVLFDFQLPY